MKNKYIEPFKIYPFPKKNLYIIVDIVNSQDDMIAFAGPPLAGAVYAPQNEPPLIGVMVFHKNFYIPSAILHEVIHATMDIARICGIKFSTARPNINSEEFITYISEFLYEQIVTKYPPRKCIYNRKKHEGFLKMANKYYKWKIKL